MKKYLQTTCMVLVLLALTFPVSAAQRDEADLLYDNIRLIGVGLSINQETGLAYCSGEVESYYHVPVEVLVQLQVYKNGAWKTLMSWSDTGTVYACVDQYYSVDPGYEYKVKVTGYICNDWGIPIESEVGEKIVNYPAN